MTITECGRWQSPDELRRFRQGATQSPLRLARPCDLRLLARAFPAGSCPKPTASALISWTTPLAHRWHCDGPGGFSQQNDL